MSSDSGTPEPKDPLNFMPVREHLDLRREPETYITKPQKRKLIYLPSNRNNIDFFRKQYPKLKKFEKDLKEEKTKFQKYFESKFIFKIHTSPERLIREENFREDLKHVDIDIISSANSKDGEWIGHSKEADFSKLIKEIQKREKEDHPTFIDVYENISKISPKDKIGSSLINRPFPDNVTPISLDVELQPIENESDAEFNQFLNGFRNFITEENGKVTDELINENVSVLRIKATKVLFDKILEISRIVSVNHAPIVELRERKSVDIKELPTILPPPENVHGILVMDSGITERHPLLEHAVDEVFAISSQRTSNIRAENPFDENGHGTMVSSIALYGDIEESHNKSNFKPEVKISSSKIMYNNQFNEPEYDEDELLEHQFERSIQRIVTNNPKCKIVNCSIGNTEKTLFDARTQFNLATMVDVLSDRYKNLIFVIAAGNNYTDIKESQYARHLLQNNKDVRITDPGSAAHALTVGALRNYNNENEMRTGLEYPSKYTRIGPGYKDMIKPELVEFGGDNKHSILGADYQWIEHARLYTRQTGTSLSTPIISNYLARLYNKFPSSSRNLIKALLISSAEIPKEKPKPIPEIKTQSRQDDWKKILNIYGYGKPKFFNAEYSDDKRVILKHDGAIELNHVQYFAINLPINFFSTQGIKEIGITLVFDPPVKRYQTSYTGNVMDFHLFKNKELEKIESSYSVPIDGDISEIPEDLKNSKIEFKPGSRLRTKGIHLKGTAVFSRTNRIELDKPLVLAVVCQDRWMKNEDFQQSYAVVVTIKHSKYEQLYQEIKSLNKIQPPVRTVIKPRARVKR